MRSGRLARAGQITLGLLWLIDGALQFQPYMFGSSFVTTVLLPNAVGQPGVIGSPVIWVARLVEAHVALFNAFAATIEVLIGIGLLYRRTVRLALLVSFAWASGIWFSGEGLGMLFTGTANPLTGAPGAALLYILAGLQCWPRGAPRRREADGAELGLLGERGPRITCGALWLGLAALWLLPANRGAGAIHDAIAAAPSGRPWLSGILDAASAATVGRGTTIAIVMALTSATIGLAVLYGWHPQTFLGLAIGLSIVYWIVGQGLGGVFTGRATDVGTAPLMILLAWMLGRAQPQCSGWPGRVAQPLSASATPSGAGLPT